MSWIKGAEEFQEKNKKSRFQHFCCDVLKTGPIPKHVAFIMDGNRRFASKYSMDRAQGHISGFDRLAQTLDWCWDLGVTEVTVYAFSIENFKRSKDEVDGLMELARQKLAKLLQEKELIMKHEVCVKLLGDIDLLPKDIQEMVSEAVIMSKNNKRATFNVCFAYTSRHEMCHAMKQMAEGVQMGVIKESDIDEDLLEKCLYSKGSEDPEVLIRTSGEVRLSDFLLWQSSFSLLSFTKQLWPEFNVWDLYAAILYYQRHFHTLQSAKYDEKIRREKLRQDVDYQCVLKKLADMKTDQPTNYSALQEMISSYKTERIRRVEKFLANAKIKEEKHLQSLVPSHSQLTLPENSYISV